MRRSFFALIAAFSLLLGLAGCGSAHTYDPLAGVETTVVTDSAGRDVEIPAEITAIAASGGTAQMILMTIAPDLLVGLSSSPSTAQRPYFPESMWRLPTFGQFYGSKASLNMEALIDAEPQLIIDLGDRKTSIRQDMNNIQRQTGIPTIFLEATLETMPEAYRTLGRILHREEQAEALAQFIEKTTAMAAENAAQITEITGTATEINYTGDVNMSKLIDVNDAQLVWNMYNAKCADFTIAKMEMFLRADMNGDKTINVSDAAAVVKSIK